MTEDKLAQQIINRIKRLQEVSRSNFGQFTVLITIRKTRRRIRPFKALGILNPPSVDLTLRALSEH